LADRADHSLAVNALSLRASVGPTELPNVWTALAIASDQTPLLHACLLHRSRDAQGFSRIEMKESGGEEPSELLCDGNTVPM